MSIVIGYRDVNDGKYYIAGDSAINITDDQKNVISTHTKYFGMRSIPKCYLASLEITNIAI